MSETRKNLLLQLAKARQKLAQAQAHVAKLEARLAGDPEQPSAAMGAATMPLCAVLQIDEGQSTRIPPCPSDCSLGLVQEDRHRQAEAVQQRYVKRLEILHEIDSGLIKGGSIETLIEVTLHHLRQLIGCQRASILLIDPTKEGWGLFAVDHTTPTTLGKGVRIPIPPNGFASFTTEKIQLIPDMRTWQEANEPDKQLVREGLISSLRVLLTVQENPMGMLSLSADRADFFTDEHQEIAKEVAGQLAIAIHQLLLSEAVARHNVALARDLADVQRKRNALRRSEERYRSVVEEQIDVICRFDANFQLTFVNQAYSALFGKSPEEMIGHSVLAGIPPEYQDRVIALIATLNAGNPLVTDENPILLADGSQRWFYWTNRILIEETGHIVQYQGVGRDITEQRNLQLEQQRHAKAVEEMRQFLQSALDAFSASTAVLACDGTIINVNATWKRLCQENGAPSPAFYLGENYLAVCDKAVGIMATEAAAAAAGIRAVIEGRQSEFYLEYAFHNPCEHRWIGMRVSPFVEATPRRVVVAHTSITERKQAEEAERTQRHFAEALLSSLVALTGSLDVESVLQQILDLVATVVPSEASSIILFEGDTGRIAYLRGFSPEAIEFFDNYRFSIDIPVFRNAFANKQPYIIPDTQAAENWIPLAVTEWIHSSLGAPIEIRGEVMGVLVVDSATPNHFQPAHMKKLQAFARYASLALENAYHATQLESRVMARTAELQTAKEQVEAILNNSLDGILLVHPDLRIEQANAAFTRLFAYPPEECLGQPLLDFIYATDADRVLTELRAALVSQVGKHVEMRARRKDGTVFDAELSIGQIQENGLVCTIRDVTERKQHERQLRYYAGLQENVSDAVFSTDLQLHIQSWNRAAETIYGWTAEEAMGQVIKDLLRSEHLSGEIYSRAREKLFQEGRWQGELQHQRKDGTALYVLSAVTVLRDENNEPIGFVAVNHDITERKQAEEAIRDSEARYRLLADNITDWVTRVNASGTYLYVSPSVRTLLGYEPEELLGQSGYPLLHPDDSNAVQLPSHVFDENTPPPIFTFRMRHKDGHYIWLEAQCRLICSAESGEVLEIISSARDITERKRAEDDLRLKTEDARQFQTYLKALHEITLELTSIDELDVFYQRAVALGLERLGFERLGLLLYDAERSLVLGTYGTDINGRLVAEHHIQLDAARLTGILKRTLKSTERFFFNAHAPLVGNSGPINFGWNAVAVLWNGKQSLGWLSVDNGIYHKPVSKPLLDILALYSLTLGTLLGRKQVEADLRASEEKFRRLLEAAPVAILISDQRGQIMLVNDRAEQLFGYSHDELTGQPVEILVPLPERHTHTHKRATYIAAPHIRPMGTGLELFVRRKDGSEFPAEIELSYIQTQAGLMVTSFVMDITERKRSAEALRQQHDFLQLVINSVPDLILVKDRVGQFQLVNTFAAQLHGITPAEMVGKRDADINRNQQEVAFFLQKDQETLDGEKAVFIPEEPLLGRYYQTSKIPLQNPAGEYDRLLVVASDITARKEAEDALQQALQKEKELGELKSRFVSMASHEFRTPLATILALTETLRAYRHKLADEQIEQRLGKIQEQVDHLRDIMEDMLQLARLQARRTEFKPVWLDLDSLCRSVMDEFQSRPDVKHQLIYTCTSALGEVKLDRKLIRQIINNLVSNAVKYSLADKPIFVSLACDNETCVFTVRDEGIGIPAADLTHLFEPFHRANNVGTIAGTGLGLTIAKEAVELHAGTITVESQVGVGTTFTVSLPVLI